MRRSVTDGACALALKRSACPCGSTRPMEPGPMPRWVVVAALLMLVMGAALPARQPIVANLTGPMRMLPD